MEQGQVGRGQAQAADSVRAAVDSERVPRWEPAQDKAEVAVGAAQVRAVAVAARGLAQVRVAAVALVELVRQDATKEGGHDAKRRRIGPHGNGAKDGQSRRVLRGIWNAGIHEPGSRSGIWDGFRLWTRRGPWRPTRLAEHVPRHGSDRMATGGGRMACARWRIALCGAH